MLEQCLITADEIALLNDEDLRTLVGRLCESEMRRRGISPSCVTWGGNQNAEDGGLDVRVALPRHVGAEGFVPRPDTGFQVKAEDMPPSKIFPEMRPDGTLRPAIRRLADQSGAYIMVSSKGSTSGFALDSRREAMAQAVSDLSNGGVHAVKLELHLASQENEFQGARSMVVDAIDCGMAGYGGAYASSSQ